MEKRGSYRVLNSIITLVVTLAVLNTAAHFALYGTGVPGVAEQGVSGFAIGKITGEQIKLNYVGLPSFSKLLIIGEWGLLVILILVSLIGDKAHLKKHVIAITLKPHDKSKTDIDVMYDLIKERKKVSLDTIAETFKIKEETASEWAKILEEANLATVHYPRFGEPEVRIKE